MSDAASTPAMVDNSVDRTMPLPLEARVGVVLAALTLLLVLVQAVSVVLRLSGVESLGGVVSYVAWGVGYAGALVWGWLGLSPRPGCEVRMRWAAAGLLGQGLTYLCFWLYLFLLGSVGTSHFGAGLLEADAAQEALFVVTGVQFAVLGPLFGALAASAGLRGDRMAFVQLLGIAGFFFVWIVG